MINTLNPDFNNTPASNRRPGYGYNIKDPVKQPYVSIITAFYNTGEIFHQTARSILNQSFQQWEWIIVNDCSNSDESLTVLNKYRDLDDRIMVIDHDKNRGPGAARNTAIGNAKADFLVQLDSDNLIESTSIEKWLWFLESYKSFSFVKGYSVGFDKDEYLWDRGFHNQEEFLNVNLVDITSMIKKEVHQKVGGYDETIRDGFEDWDFWLNCATNGYWGGTVPEYLDWYRRRVDHSKRWANWDDGAKQREFRNLLKQKYNKLWNDGFPRITATRHVPNENVSTDIPFDNLLAKEKNRILLIVPWLTIGGSDKFTLDLAIQLIKKGWELSIVTTKKDKCLLLNEFLKLTPDIFLLSNFLRLPDYPRFITYLIRSRAIDAVLITQSELGYMLLPYLRSEFPEIPFLDYCHIEEEYWKNGGYPAMSVKYSEFLEKTFVSSGHLKKWMTNKGKEENNIEVCYTNIDFNEWIHDDDARNEVRNKLSIPAETVVILFVGRLVEQKQPVVLAKTINKLSKATSEFKFIVAGNGEYLTWLKKYLRDNKLEKHIIFLGMVENEYIKRLMSASDIFFLPSKWEGIALSLYEAMSCGLAVVAARVGGQSELVSEDCGFLIERANDDIESDRYAGALKTLVSDRRLIKTMGKCGRKRIVKYFGIEKMGEQSDLQLNKLIELKKNGIGKMNPTIPSKSLGIISASNAVETIRLNDLADELWKRGSGMHIKERIFLFLKNHLDETYCRLIDKGWIWLEPVKDKLKKLLIN